MFVPCPTRLTRRASAAQLIPEDMSFQAIDEPCYVSSDEMARALRADMCCCRMHLLTQPAPASQVRIQKESEVRLRIVGTRNDANEIVRARLRPRLGRAGPDSRLRPAVLRRHHQG